MSELQIEFDEQYERAWDLYHRTGYFPAHSFPDQCSLCLRRNRHTVHMFFGSLDDPIEFSSVCDECADLLSERGWVLA